MFDKDITNSILANNSRSLLSSTVSQIVVLTFIQIFLSSITWNFIVREVGRNFSEFWLHREVHSIWEAQLFANDFSLKVIFNLYYVWALYIVCFMKYWHLLGCCGHLKKSHFMFLWTIKLKILGQKSML